MALATSGDQFNPVYWASKSPAVNALRNLDFDGQSGSDRTSQATLLALNGEIIDVPIMIWGWDPYKVMVLRINYGYTWVPSALEPPVQNAPGSPGNNNFPAYNPETPSQHMIKVSIDLDDYPAYKVAA